MVQWLRLCTPNAAGLGSVPGQGTRSCILKLKRPYAAAKTWCSQIKSFPSPKQTDNKYWSIELPWWLSGTESACQCRRCRLNPWVGKIHSRRKWQLTPVFLPGESHKQRSLAGYSPWGHKRVGHDLVTKQQIVIMLATSSNSVNVLDTTVLYT